MRAFSYARPARLTEAVAILQEYGADARVLAGGTDLIIRMRDGGLSPAMVVDVKGVAELRPGVRLEDGGLVISATTVMTDLARDPLVHRRFPALVEAASVVGSIQIRNRATLAGNVCNASPAADTVPVLAVLGASVLVQGPRAVRSMPVVDFILGNRSIALERGELVTGVRIPVPSRPLGTAFARLTRRRGVDLASVNLCCSVDEAGVTSFAFGAVSPRPLLVRDGTGVLADPRSAPHAREAALDSLVQHATPITDVRASEEYRLAMLRVLGTRAVRSAIERLRQGVVR